MEAKEVDKVLSYLQTAYPNANWQDKRQAAGMRTVWQDILKTFPYEVAQDAAKLYIHRGGKFFPAIGEFVKLCDECWQEHERVRREEIVQAERDAARLLFSEPLDKVKKKGGNIAAMSVALVRDVCNDKIKYKSPEWNKRQAEIEDMAR